MAGRSSRAVRTAVAAAAGTWLLGTGLGIAVACVEVASWRSSGTAQTVDRLPPVRGALAVLAVVIGLALVAAAVRTALRAAARSRFPRAGRALLAVTAAVVVLLGLLPAGGAATLLWPPRGQDPGPEPAARGLAGSDVRFDTSDGVRLAGWWAPGTNGAAVVLVPGTYGTRSGVLDQALVLARHGYGVLLLDPRGNGASGGTADGHGWFLERDLAAAVTFVLGRPEVRGGRVGLLGESLGGEAALGAAAADPRVRVVVAEGVTSRGPADLGPLRAQGVRGAVLAAGYEVVYAQLRLLSGAPRPRPLADAVAATATATGRARPVLLVAAGARGWEVAAADAVRRQALARSPDAPVEVWVVPGGAHAAGLAQRPQEWQRRVLAVLDAALGPRP